MLKTTAEIMELKVKFYGLARFPKVIGAIDCTHIKLQSPSREYGEKYRNRKGYFSLNFPKFFPAKHRGLIFYIPTR